MNIRIKARIFSLYWSQAKIVGVVFICQIVVGSDHFKQFLSICMPYGDLEICAESGTSFHCMKLSHIARCVGFWAHGL